MTKYVVTGGAGFIGSNITKELVRRGQKVKVIDGAEQIKKNLILADICQKVEFMPGDITDLAFLKKAFKGADYILHQAAIASVIGSIEDPLTTNKTNIEGTLNVLIAARDNHIKRVVIASSSAIYGNNPKPIKTEGLPPDPLSPYALSKLTTEFYARIFDQLYNLETVCLRYFNVFGPGQNPHSQYAAVIPAFITRMINHEPPVIYGDGTQGRDFISVKDVARANILAATRASISGQIFNIGTGKSVSLNQLVDMINKILKTKIKPIYKKARPGDIKHSRANITRAQTIMGFKPKISIQEGLKEAIQWYQEAAKKN